MSQINTGGMRSDFEKLPGMKFDQVKTGYIDNNVAAVRLALNNDNVTSLFRNRGMYNDRNAQIHSYIENGQIPGKIANSYRGDYGAVAMWARINAPGLKIPTDKELDAERDALVNKENASAQKVFKDQSLAGAFGQGFGTLTGTLANPLYIPPIFVGGIGVAAKGAQFLKTLGTVMAVEGAAETVNQMAIYNHKADIGVDYSVTDAVQNILIITAFAGTAEGALFVGKKFLKSLEGKTAVKQMDEFVDRYKIETPEGKAAVKDIKHVRDMLKHAGDDNAEEFLVRVEETEDGLNQAGPRKTTETGPVTPDDADADTAFETLFETRKAEDPVKAAQFDKVTAKAESDILSIDEILKECT